MNLAKLKPFILVASIAVILMNYRIWTTAILGDYPVEGVIYTAVLISLLPAAILMGSLLLLRGGDNRIFRMMLGVLAMNFALEYCADPWSLTLQMGLGSDLVPFIIYTVIGTVFLLISVFAFKQT